MKSKTASLRWWLLCLWLISVACVILVFLERMFSHRNLPMRFDEISAAFKTVLAFYFPTMTTMLSFLFSAREHDDQSELSSSQMRAALAFSVLYHLCFVSVVVMGVSFYVFDQSKPGGEGFAANTSTIAVLLGGLSVLLIPINMVFLSGGKKRESDGG
jgi:hypothetical protein